MVARGPRGVGPFAFYRFLTPCIGACVGEIYNNYINRTRRPLCLQRRLLCEFTDTCEDFNDSENRDGLTVVLAHTDYLFDLHTSAVGKIHRLGYM